MRKLVDYLYVANAQGVLGELVFVDQVETGEMYEWNTIMIGYHPTHDKFYWVSGSGCSCNFIGDNVNSIADLESGDRGAMVRAVQRHLDGSFDARPDFAARTIAGLRTWKFDA